MRHRLPLAVFLLACMAPFHVLAQPHSQQLLDEYLNFDLYGLVSEVRSEPGNPSVELALDIFVDNKAMVALIPAFGGDPEAPKRELKKGENPKSLVFKDLQLDYCERDSVFRSRGPLHITNFEGRVVDLKLTGWIEVAHKGKNRKVEFLLFNGPKTWWYGKYNLNLFQTISTVEEFNERVKNTPAGRRKLKEKTGKPPYQYLASSASKKVQFNRRMQDACQ